MKQINAIIYTIFLVVFIMPLQAHAAPLPFMPSFDKDKEITAVSSDSFLGGITRSLGELVAPAYSWGITIITTLFVVGTVVMILSTIFKNGQWQKYGQGTMLISFIVMLVLRGLPIIILSIRTADDIDILFSNALTSLSYSAIFLGMVSIAVSFLFRFGYHLIEHPEFHRWSRNLLSVSILMMILAISIPILFPII